MLVMLLATVETKLFTTKKLESTEIDSNLSKLMQLEKSHILQSITQSPKTAIGNNGLIQCIECTGYSKPYDQGLVLHA